MNKTFRIATLIGFCVVSWGAGSALVAAPALASTCLPQGSTCSPDDFTGELAGTLLAVLVSPVSVSGAFSATYTDAVYKESGGTLDFYLQAVNNTTSSDAITQLSVSDFQGALADMGYRTDGSTLPSGSFVDGSQTPTDVTRATSGDPIAWDFTGSNPANMLPPGDTSYVLEVKTNAVQYTLGTVTLTSGGGGVVGSGFAPVVTQMSSTPSPTTAHTGTTLQDSATLLNATSLDGTGSITFNLFAPGDATCTTPIHTETVTGISSDGPWSTTTGYVAGTPGTYQWVASFSGDSKNPAGTTGCGDEPVPVTLPSQITLSSTTCTQFAGGTSSTLLHAYYSVAHGKIKAVAPAGFAYWAAVTSTGGTQTYHLDQFTNETSRPFLLGSGSAVFTSGCTSVGGTFTQSGGAVTVTFNGGSPGATYLIGIHFSTSHVVGEPRPGPSGMVRYLFQAGTSTRELDLVK
ncbi:MAG: hypothetical protein ACHQ4F_11850 [Candidatus Dormibacteria bacterium]